MECRDVDELLPSLALGAVTADEQRELETHLAGCQQHPHMAGYRAVAGMLPLSTPPVPPSSEVKNRLMARVYGDLEPKVIRPPFWRQAGSWLIAAALALVALGLGIRDWSLGRQTPAIWQLRPTGALQAAGTLVYVPGQDSATLTLQQLAPLPGDRVYEAWLIRGGTPEPAGVFTPKPDGTASVMVKAPSGYDTVAVTSEPGPDGSQAPTTQPFVAATLG